MLYESEADRQREVEVARAIEKATGWELVRCDDTRSAVDWIAYEDDYLGTRSLVAVIEVKGKGARHNQFPAYLIDTYKWNAIRALSDALFVPGLVVVKFTNGLGWFDTGDDSGVTTMTNVGRDDRGDPNDKSDVFRVPTSRIRSVASLATAVGHDPST